MVSRFLRAIPLTKHQGPHRFMRPSRGLRGVRSGSFRKHSLIDGGFWWKLLQLVIHRIYAQDESCDHSGVKMMSKGMDSKKQTRKEPAKTMKEKRAAKRAKRAARGAMG